MRTNFKNELKKSLDKASPKIRRSFEYRFQIFLADPFHPLLNNHALQGKYEGFRSINITGDWRAIFREIGNYQLVIFETLGPHNQLYK